MRSKWVQKRLQCADGHLWTDLVGPGKNPKCPQCGGEGHRPDPIEPLSATVFDDVLWGGPRFIRNLDVTPIWVETKSEYRALLNAKGFRVKDDHVGVPGTDKSPITQSWSLPSTQDVRPFAFLSPDEQAQRRREAAERFGCTVDELESLASPSGSAGIEVPYFPRPAAELTAERSTSDRQYIADLKWARENARR